MPEISMYRPGTFCWPELTTSDPAGAKKFYSGLFGWKTEDSEIAPGMIYTMALLKDKSVGAMYTLTDEMKGMNIPPHWLQYVSVDSADAATARAKSLGGTVLRDPMDVMDIGRMAVIQDPTGATVALWKPRTAIGAGLINEHGTITWNELLTNDIDRSGKFYTHLFGWGSDTKDMGGMTYTTFVNGERPAAGMMAITKDMGDVRPNWMQYFAIDACDKGAARIKKLRGRILAGPRDIPEVGRFAVAQDPQGAVFAVIELLNPPS